MSDFDELEKNFENSAIIIKTKDGNISVEDLLILYGLYKQVRIGNCNDPAPWQINIVDYKKWEAWYKNYDMDKKTAMQKYIEKVEELMK